jgi:hypothetical protein
MNVEREYPPPDRKLEAMKRSGEQFDRIAALFRTRERERLDHVFSPGAAASFARMAELAGSGELGNLEEIIRIFDKETGEFGRHQGKTTREELKLLEPLSARRDSRKKPEG